jgi:hypothetical protein
METPWSQPPPKGGLRRLAAALADARCHPSVWRFVGIYSSLGGAGSVASRIKRGRIGPGGNWTTACRKTERGDAKLWVRFDGADPDEPA